MRFYTTLSLIFGAVLSVLLIFSSQAQTTDSTKVNLDEDVSLEDLMNIPVTVASRKATTLRESPGIITVVTEEEIRNMGARDLIDVLRMIPGIDFGQDYQNFVSLGMRGNWASEGKVAVFVDGIAINENLYATIPLGNHFSPDLIQRIEIIRGPGSAMYGGVAELGVINIITKQGKDLNGVQGSAMYGQQAGGFGRLSGSLALGKEYKSGLQIHLKSWYSKASRGDGIYYQQDDPTQSFKMIGNHTIYNFTLDGGISYKGFNFNFLIDQYNPRQRNGVGINLPYAINNNFNNYSANIRYDWAISSKVKLTPQYIYSFQRPWISEDSSYGWFSNDVQRHLARVELSYDPIQKINILVGAQFFNDFGYARPNKFSGTASFYFPPSNTTTVSYQNYSGYVQALWNTKIINITGGIRYDRHSLGFDALVPRFAITKNIKRFHFKLLAAEAFRAPYILNISSDSIKPEKATVYEAELGYQITNKMNISINAFDISIKDALYFIYNVDPVTSVVTEGYFNGAKTGTRGLEVVGKYKDKWGYVEVNYSYYTTAGKNQIPTIAVDRSMFKNPSDPGINTGALLAFAPHKVNAVINLKLTKNLNWNVSANYLSKRFGYDRILSGDSAVYMQSFPALLLLNTFVQYDNLFVKGLGIGAGCYNIMNKANPFIMAYTSTVSAMPGLSREFIIRINYKF